MPVQPYIRSTGANTRPEAGSPYNTAIAVGTLVGALCVLILLFASLFCCIRRRRSLAVDQMEDEKNAETKQEQQQNRPTMTIMTRPMEQIGVVIDPNIKKRSSGDGGNMKTPDIPFSPRDNNIAMKNVTGRKSSMAFRTPNPVSLTAIAAARRHSKSPQQTEFSHHVNSSPTPTLAKSPTFESNESLEDIPTTPAGVFHYEVMKPWLPQRMDELWLKPGDMVTVFRIFDDGWCEGKVDGVEEHGVFPTACLKADEWNLFGVPIDGDSPAPNMQ